MRSLKISQFFYTTNAQLLVGILELTKDKHICKVVKFVNNIMFDETLFKTQTVYYIAVLYFFQLLLNSQKKIKTVKMILKIVNDL